MGAREGKGVELGKGEPVGSFGVILLLSVCFTPHPNPMASQARH